MSEKKYIKPQLLEENPKYWPPPVNSRSLEKYIINWIKEGKYPPKLSKYERKIVDMKGLRDKRGNVYDVTWTLGGHPLSAKIAKDGHMFTQDKPGELYKAYYGDFDVRYLP